MPSCRALTPSAPLRSAARAHSADMLVQGYFDHDSRGETWEERIARYLKSPLIGENIAMVQGPNGSASSRAPADSSLTGRSIKRPRADREPTSSRPGLAR